MKQTLRAWYLVLFGVFLGGILQVAGAVTRYVDLNSPSPTPPYTNWATAANVIQDAVSISTNGDVVLVTNGVYSTGGEARADIPTLTNRVFVTNNVHVTSVNGPLVTSIVGRFDPATGGAGSNAIRCAYVGGLGRLSGFTLTNGSASTINNVHLLGGGGLAMFGNGGASNLIIRNCRTQSHGGGVLFSSISGPNSLSDSIITRNQSGSNGGGVHFNGAAVLRNCVVSYNVCNNGTGGGIRMGLSGEVESCTIVGNSAGTGIHGLQIAAGSGATVVGTIIYGNTTNLMAQYDVPNSNLVSFSCTTPVASGPGNIAADPRFLDAEQFHLHPASPCVDAGTNQSWMLSAAAKDLDGEPRLRNGKADIGADEAWQFMALSLAQTGGNADITWDVLSNGVFKLQAATNLTAQQWFDTGIIVTSTVPYVTTTLINASAPFEALRLERTAP